MVRWNISQYSQAFPEVSYGQLMYVNVNGAIVERGENKKYAMEGAAVENMLEREHKL